MILCRIAFRRVTIFSGLSGWKAISCLTWLSPPSHLVSPTATCRLAPTLLFWGFLKSEERTKNVPSPKIKYGITIAGEGKLCFILWKGSAQFTTLTEAAIKPWKNWFLGFLTKQGCFLYSCMIHKSTNPNLIVCSAMTILIEYRLRGNPVLAVMRMRMKSFLLLVVHFCTFINQEENMSRTLPKAALALVLLWILVACWSLGGAITETTPLCCGETQLSRSEREDQCLLPLFQPFLIPPTQPQALPLPGRINLYFRWVRF